MDSFGLSLKIDPPLAGDTKDSDMGDIRFQDFLASWQALKMLFAVFPGICLVTWAGYVGWSDKGPSIHDLWMTWRDMSNAKREGLKELGRVFVPAFPLLIYLLIVVILCIIPSDNILTLVINFCAIPAAVLSYLEGRRVRHWRRSPAKLHDFDLPWPAFLRVMGLWLILSAIVMVILYAFDLWQPS